MLIQFVPPEHFAPKFHVVSCYVEHDGKILWLLRNPEKSEGDKWGAPAGKIDAGETPSMAVAREVAEETGIAADESAFTFMNTAYVRYPDYDFVFHVFRLPLAEPCDVTIRPDEHQRFTWASPLDALGMRLVLGNVELLHHFYV